MGVEQAVKLEPVGAPARKLDWTTPPVVLWRHVMKAKPDATSFAPPPPRISPKTAPLQGWHLQGCSSTSGSRFGREPDGVWSGVVDGDIVSPAPAFGCGVVVGLPEVVAVNGLVHGLIIHQQQVAAR